MGVKLWPGSTFPLALACGKMGLLRSFVCTRRNCLPTSISFIMDAQSGRLRGVFLYCSSLTATCSGISFSTHKFQSAKVSFHSFCISCFFYFVVEVVAEVAEVRPSAEEVAEGEAAAEEWDLLQGWVDGADQRRCCSPGETSYATAVLQLGRQKCRRRPAARHCFWCRDETAISSRWMSASVQFRNGWAFLFFFWTFWRFASKQIAEHWQIFRPCATSANNKAVHFPSRWCRPSSPHRIRRPNDSNNIRSSRSSDRCHCRGVRLYAGWVGSAPKSFF